MKAMTPHTLGAAFTLVFLPLENLRPGFNKEPAGRAEMWCVYPGPSVPLSIMDGFGVETIANRANRHLAT